MLAVERRNLILEKLQNERKVVVSELSALFDVSEETIRRDLDKLDREGLAIKSYGGAVLNENSGMDMPFNVRKKRNMKAKQEIAALVAGLVQEGEHIIASQHHGGGCGEGPEEPEEADGDHQLHRGADRAVGRIWLGNHLHRRDPAGELPDFGGLQGCRCDQLFPGGQGDSVLQGRRPGAGVTDAHEALSQIKHTMLKSARQRILAVDHTKFGNVAFSRMRQLSDIDMVVTDIRPEQKWMDYFAEKGIVCLYDREENENDSLCE